MQRKKLQVPETVVWSYRACNQYVATLARIADEDPLTAEQVQQRVEKSLQLLSGSLVIGTVSPSFGVRTYVVPKTGHSFDYRLVRGQILIQRWFRQRQIPINSQDDVS